MMNVIELKTAHYTEIEQMQTELITYLNKYLNSKHKPPKILQELVVDYISDF